MKDFFISYNSHDKQDAEWIAWTLEEANYTTVIQSWDFSPGQNFVLEMHNAAIVCNKTIAVLTNDYLAALFTQSEWASAFAKDPLGQNKVLIPVRVKECQPPGLLQAIVYCDLVNLSEDEAKARLLSAVAQNRNKPAERPKWGFTTSNSEKYRDINNYPKQKINELASLLETTNTTFIAQARLRNSLYEKVNKRLNIKERLQYEEFFRKYFDKLDFEEMRLHQIVRGYTENILYEYNVKILSILNEEGSMLRAIKNIEKLKNHLIVWIGKYKSIFLHDKTACLIYVGVEEKVPFPTGVEAEVKKLLDIMK